MKKRYLLTFIVLFLLSCEKKLISESNIKEIIIVDNNIFDTLRVKDSYKINELINTFNQSKEVDIKFGSKYRLFLKSNKSTIYILVNGKFFKYKNNIYMAPKPIRYLWKNTM